MSGAGNSKVIAHHIGSLRGVIALQLEQYGNLWLESYDAAEGTYMVGYDLTVPMPPMLPNPGTFTVTAEQLKDAFGE